MPRDKRDKTTGLPLPSPVDPGTAICFQMRIPNAPEYIQALRGVIADLGKPWIWQQTVGQLNEGAYEAAELWRKAATTITYSEDCEGAMACIDVANCIETNGAVRDAIANQLTFGDSQTNIYNTSQYGIPMTATSLQQPISVSDGCNKDVLFGSITAIVDQLNQNNLDFLEILLLSDNQAKRVAKVWDAIPLLNQIPGPTVIEFVSQLVTEVKENYDAQWTSALRDAYRCGLFCLTLEDEACELTFEMIFNFIQARIGAALDPANFFASAVIYFTTGAWAGSQLVDIMMLIQVAAWRQASSWLGLELGLLQTVALLGANDPDPDWNLLCTDCNTAPVKGFIVYGNVGTTTVSQVGNVYTIEGGFTGPFGNTYIYVGISEDGVPVSGTPGKTLVYTSLSVNGVIAYDWGNEGGSYTSVPPASAPPPNVYYAGGAKTGGPISSVSIVIETTLPYQGLIQGA